MWKLALAAVLGVVFTAAPAHAQSKESLRGIAGVRVSVTVADAEARKDGLPEGALRALLEERARSAGLRLTDDSMAPRLSLVVNTQKYTEEGVYALAVDLDLYQLVSLARTDAPPFHASTWRVTQVFVRAADDLGSVRAVVERAADVFVKDFLTANGKQP